MEYYRSNFDFENQLSSLNFKMAEAFNQNKLNYEFEYLYFLLNYNGVLNTPIKYDLDYLSYIQKIFNVFPRVENRPQKNYKYWWGSLEDIKLARKLNDKEFFWKFCLYKALPYPKTIVSMNNYHELLCERIIIRRKLGFSGVGTKIILQKDLKLKEGFEIASEYMKREMDFSLIVYQDSFSIYKTIVDDRGQFKGVQTIECSSLLNEISCFIARIRNLEEVGEYPFQIDGFISNRKIFFNELNYRQTMGRVFHHLIHKYYPDKDSRLILYRYKDYLKLNKHCPDRIYLTPMTNKFKYRFGIVMEIKDINNKFRV